MIGEKVKLILKQRGLSQADLGRLIGKERSNVTNLLKSDNPGIQTVNQIAEVLHVPLSMLVDKNPPITNLGALPKANKESSTNAKPLLPIEAIAGFGSDDWSIKETDIQERYVLPDFSDCDFLVTVRGDSMKGKYNSGDIVACRKILDPQFIQWNRVFVVSTKNQGLVIKRLSPSDKEGCVKALSDNKDYPPFEIPIDDITGLAMVLGGVWFE